MVRIRRAVVVKTVAEGNGIAKRGKQAGKKGARQRGLKTVRGSVLPGPVGWM